MAAIITLFDRLMETGASPEVNALLRALLDELGNTYHVWVAPAGYGDLAPRLPRRTSVSTRALQDWERAVYALRLLPDQLRQAETDDETVVLLNELAAHPVDAVRIPAAMGLGMISRVPPLAATRALQEAARRGALHRYVFASRPPSWWQRPCIDYRARRWEALCVELAERLYGADRVLAGLRNETLCSEGIVPDIIVGEVERDGEGRVVHAELMIDAKSGQLPDQHSYCHRCDRLEYWHSEARDAWVVWRRGYGDCEVIYRDARELERMAPPEVAAQIAAFREGANYFDLYLQFLADRALTALGPGDLAASGLLEE